MNNLDFDIVIVGLGPTGGTLANLLAMNNVSVLILEKEANIYNLPRAVHFDDEIMRVFQTIGITKSLSKKLIINKGTKFIDDNGELLLDWPRPKKITENGWYPSYRFHQPDLERSLRHNLKKYKNVTIVQNAEVYKTINKKNYVEVNYKNTKTNKIYSLKSKYLIGCDGANSFLRNEINSEMEHLGFEQRWAVIDVILKRKKMNLPDRTIQYCSQSRPATYCRNVGRRRRWEIALKDDERADTFFEEETLWKFLSRWIVPDEAKIERKTIYTFQSAIAKQWRKGRIFLVGDAAHLTPPFMGQGMCAGIRDASNLAWKITMCCNKGHNEKLLDTYQSERSSNVRDYIKTAMKMGELLNSIGGSDVSDTVFIQPDGSIKMNTIKPKLGKGLGISKDPNRGKIFPSLKNEFGKDIDFLYSSEPILITNRKIDKNNFDIKIFDNIDIPKVETILKKFKSDALIIRPDRFILASTNEKDLVNFSESCLSQINNLEGFS